MYHANGRVNDMVVCMVYSEDKIKKNKTVVVPMNSQCCDSIHKTHAISSQTISQQGEGHVNYSILLPPKKLFFANW